MKTKTLTVDSYMAQWLANIIEDKIQYIEEVSSKLHPLDAETFELLDDAEALQVIVNQLRAR